MNSLDDSVWLTQTRLAGRQVDAHPLHWVSAQILHDAEHGSRSSLQDSAYSIGHNSCFSRRPGARAQHSNFIRSGAMAYVTCGGHQERARMKGQNDRADCQLWNHKEAAWCHQILNCIQLVVDCLSD